ncbi:MAG: hypothetical protein COA92_07920, partial [Sulfurovum sp.]
MRIIQHKTIQTITLALGLTLFTACGGGGGSTATGSTATGGGTGGGTPTPIVKESIIFSFNGEGKGIEPWITDGESASLLGDLNTQGSSSGTGRLAIIGGVTFFTADDGVHGRELWKSDGTEAGTVMVKDIYTGSYSSRPENIISVNGTVYFTATTSAQGEELWKSDGT